MPTITISVPAYNEIAAILEQQGHGMGDGKTLTIERGTQLKSPIDFRMVTIRRDVADIATKANVAVDRENFMKFVKELYEWVVQEKPANT